VNARAHGRGGPLRRLSPHSPQRGAAAHVRRVRAGQRQARRRPPPENTALWPALYGNAAPAVTTALGNHELDDVAAGKRASVRYRAARRTAPVGGSNRLLSVEELAAYLGVPKKTVYGCWRQWGLRGYRVGRYLRFRERHVEEWLQTREI
jgi:excisionase family DNA binding protein